jgi:hypothetical protein
MYFFDIRTLTTQYFVLPFDTLHLCYVTGRVEQSEFSVAVATLVFAHSSRMNTEGTGFFRDDQRLGRSFLSASFAVRGVFAASI